MNVEWYVWLGYETNIAGIKKMLIFTSCACAVTNLMSYIVKWLATWMTDSANFHPLCLFYLFIHFYRRNLVWHTLLEVHVKCIDVTFSNFMYNRNFFHSTQSGQYKLAMLLLWLTDSCKPVMTVGWNKEVYWVAVMTGTAHTGSKRAFLHVGESGWLPSVHVGPMCVCSCVHDSYMLCLSQHL